MSWHTPKDQDGRAIRFGKGASRLRREQKRLEAEIRNEDYQERKRDGKL